MKEKTILIVGGGPRIGLSVARAFKANGWNAVIASRSPDAAGLMSDGLSSVVCDVASASSVAAAFDVVKEQHGVPEVVVYNAAALTMADTENPFAMEAERFVKDLEVNLIGGYSVLHETTKAWSEKPTTDAEGGRVFIATGNVTPFRPVTTAMTLGSGKAGLVHLIEIGNKAYGPKGWRFYFVSQVTEEGGPVPYQDVDGVKHGEAYLKLAEDHGMLKGKEWDTRFVP